MRRLVAAGLLPERAGQPVKAWAHISLADPLRLDGDSALQEQWTAQVRAAWAARRAAASETGSGGGAWLDGDAAEAIACDAAMTPVVTGDVDVDALEGLVRLCVELDRLRQGGQARPDTTAAWAALEQAVIGKTTNFLLHYKSCLELGKHCDSDAGVAAGTRTPACGTARLTSRNATRQRSLDPAITGIQCDLHSAESCLWLKIRWRL